MGLLSFIFGYKKNQVKEYLENGARILDVRSQEEWDRGHIDNSIHIPLDDLINRIDDINHLEKPMIVCCQSGVRSAKAARFLNLHNISAINGGGWVSLNKQL
ncbi:MAG: rhodanese-like domain-containing protein [Psychroserpens sp.]|uniref:rhodanese-like domain-containing protein n=1 Tax=Psychroserpens sp. TaxID=2020870 RepID=UPI003CB4D697